MRSDCEEQTLGLQSVAVLLIFAFALASCNSRPQVVPSVNVPGAATGVSYDGSSDDWTTFAHDYRRSGYNPSVTWLKPSNVSNLKLRWTQNVGQSIYSSPLVYAGNVVVVSEGSEDGRPPATVYDYRASDGQLLWKFVLGSRAQMTPTIDPDAGLLIVGNGQQHAGKPSYLYALRLLDGSLVWRQTVYGLLRSTPVVTGGLAYIGRAGGDPPRCEQGGVSAVNESTGDVVWTWNVDPKPNEGGSVWGAIAYNGSRLFFGTGNTCRTPMMTANGAVGMSPEGHLAWSMVAVKDAHYDSDTGGGVMLYNGRGYFINKNGRFYAVNQQTGDLAWSVDLNPGARAPEWRGGFATPSTDGTTILEGSGLYPDSKGGTGGEFCMLTAVKPSEVFKGFHSKLEALDFSGHVLWTRKMVNRIVGDVAISPGLGFAGLNEEFVALDLSTGKTLWHYSTAPNYINASMAVVGSGVYGADQGGNVYAFSFEKKRAR